MKPVSEFGVNRSLTDGLQAKCKLCIRAQKDNLRQKYRSVMPAAEKVCRQCRVALPASEFSANSASPDKLQATCKGCARSYLLAHRYGLTADRYGQILASQNGRCAICGTPECSTGRAFAVDHDHTCCPTRRSCGKCVRALLCWNCNHTLGVMREDPAVYQRAIEYIELIRR